MATTTKAAKQVQIVARYAHKTDGKLNANVTYAVRSSNGKSIYCTTLIEGKASGCSCPSRYGRCYHRTQLEALEAKREVVAIAEPVLVEAEQVAEPVEEYRMSESVYAKLASIAKPVAVATPVVEAPKPTYRIITVPGAKKERFDLLAEIEAKRELKSDMLGEINAIKARKRSEDRMMKAPLTQNRAFSILR